MLKGHVNIMEKNGKKMAGRVPERDGGTNLLTAMIEKLLLVVQQLSDRVGALEARVYGIAGPRIQIGDIETIIKEILMGGTSDMETRMDLAEQAVWSAFDEVERLNHEVERMNSKDQNNSKARIVGLQSLIQALEMKIAEQDARLAQQVTRLKILEETSYNGELLWKISGMAQKRHDAIIGKITAIDSVCFFTSRTGYKMRAQVYLNGYGRGEDTHISVFFVMMKGEYDAILPWPFRQKVSVKAPPIDHVQERQPVENGEVHRTGAPPRARNGAMLLQIWNRPSEAANEPSSNNMTKFLPSLHSQVTFALLDQDRQEDVTDSFHAGDYPTSPSFARPGGEANLPCGTPDFVPLEQVYNSGRAYVRDDTMFLKITVDTAGLH
ncbi:hypothetical protein Bbelb_045290 [Branchiostoma belcheri]|nr:hypothetical protein Bbelb_045290 [Branchiostoma belcheri]